MKRKRPRVVDVKREDRRKELEVEALREVLRTDTSLGGVNVDLLAFRLWVRGVRARRGGGGAMMSSDGTLARMVELARQVGTAVNPESDPVAAGRASRELAALTGSLNAYLEGGGILPRAWAKARHERRKEDRG